VNLGSYPRDLAFEPLGCFLKAFFKLRNALLLPADPFGLKSASFGFDLRKFLAGLALHFLHFVAAAMEIRDQIASLA